MLGILTALRKSIMKLKLKQRLIILNVLSIIIPALTIIYITISMTKGIMTQQTIKLTKNTISQVSNNIDALINNQVIHRSNILMYEEKLYDMLKNNLSDDAEKERKKMVDIVVYGSNVSILSVLSDYISVAALYGKNGELFNFSLPAAKEELVLERLQQMGALTRKKNHVIKWYPAQKNFFTVEKSLDIRQEFVVIASRAISNPKTGEYLGTQIYTICEQAIYNSYSDIELGKTGKIFVIDKAGNTVSHSNENELLSSAINTELVNDILKMGDSVFHFTIDRNKFLIITKTSQKSQWITVGMVPEKEIYGEINNIINYIMLIMFAFIMISFVSMVITADEIVKPIKKLEKAITAVENGDLNIRVDIKGDYEISKLGRYFNRMLDQINKLIQDEYVHERKIKEAELNVLMAQISPHFLYNTLESIVWKARAMKAYEISEMASSLGKLFRISISKGNVIVYVEEELEHVKAYINIQKMRYGNNFDFHLDIQDEKVLKYKTLKLLLQPIVENSLSYGIEHSDKKGIIRIKVVQDGNKLTFEVSDNGAGISEARLKEIKKSIYSDDEKETINQNVPLNQKYSQGPGIGLKNIHNRIQLYFGAEYGIHIESNEYEGTVAYVTVPVLDEPVSNVNEHET